jgi:hypothetical protein
MEGNVKHVFCDVENTCLLKCRGIFFFSPFRRHDKNKQLNLYIHIFTMQRSLKERKENKFFRVLSNANDQSTE